MVFFLENNKILIVAKSLCSAKELLRPNRGRCHLSSRREKENIPNLKAITAEERQEGNLPKVNVAYMNQIYGESFDCSSLIVMLSKCSNPVNVLPCNTKVQLYIAKFQINQNAILQCPENGTPNVR